MLAFVQYMDFIEIFSVSLDLSTIYLLVLVGDEVPLWVVVALFQVAVPISGVKLSIRPFCFISVSGMDFLAGRSVAGPQCNPKS